MPPSTAGREARRYFFEQALEKAEDLRFVGEEKLNGVSRKPEIERSTILVVFPFLHSVL